MDTEVCGPFASADSALVAAKSLCDKYNGALATVYYGHFQYWVALAGGPLAKDEAYRPYYTVTGITIML